MPDRIVTYVARIAVRVPAENVDPDPETDVAYCVKEGLIEYGHNVADVECSQD